MASKAASSLVVGPEQFLYLGSVKFLMDYVKIKDSSLVNTPKEKLHMLYKVHDMTRGKQLFTAELA